MYHLYVCILPHNDQLGRTYFGQNWYVGAGDSPMANFKKMLRGFAPSINLYQKIPILNDLRVKPTILNDNRRPNMAVCMRR